jgi:hypothetical protein
MPSAFKHAFKFCPYCGSKLKMAYPGAGRQADGSWHTGDPEDGPASLRCLQNADHGGPWDLIEEKIHESEQETIVEFLHKTRMGYRDTPEDPKVSGQAVWAATVLLCEQHMLELWWKRWRYEYQRETWIHAPWYGNEVEDCPPTRRQVFQHLTRKRS